MKNLLLSLLLLAWLPSQAQVSKARRVYRSGDYLVVADSAGTNPIAYPVKNTSLYVKGNYVFVQTTAGAFAYQPAKLLNQNGAVYSSASPTAAFSSFMTSAPAATAAGTITATTYDDALAQTATLTTAAIVKVVSDNSPGNAGTGLNGANPTTKYVYFPGDGLQQLVIYPN